jgi:hypothetical protein
MSNKAKPAKPLCSEKSGIVRLPAYCYVGNIVRAPIHNPGKNQGLYRPIDNSRIEKPVVSMARLSLLKLIQKGKADKCDGDLSK